MYEAAYLVFFETWYHLAEGRDTDEKRLAFYDTIMRYAFQGIEPERPVKGQSPGEAWAAWDAFVVAKDKIDAHRSKVKAGMAGKGVSRNAGNHNALRENQNINKAETKQIQCTMTATSDSALDINKSKNRNKNKRDNTGSCDPALSRSRQVLKDLFEEFWRDYPSNCPRKYDKRKCLDKWLLIFRGAKDEQTLYNAIMDGLGRWKRSAMWNEADGQYIRAPLVWLNGSCWEDAPKDCGGPEPVPKKPLVVKAADWQLCAERCSTWNAGKCDGGCKVPPQLRPRPIPPEDCEQFMPLEG